MSSTMNLPELSVDLASEAKRSAGPLSGLDEECLRWAIARYRKFLTLQRVHWGQSLAPTEEIDEVWHLHMLRPPFYYADCMNFFGALLDHDAGFGRKPEEWEDLTARFSRTARLWNELFDEPYIPLDVPAGFPVALPSPHSPSHPTADGILDHGSSIEARLVARAWSDPDFREELLEHPKTAIQEEIGITLPPDLDIIVVEESPGTRCLVLPTTPQPTAKVMVEAPFIETAQVSSIFSPVTCCTTTAAGKPSCRPDCLAPEPPF